MSELGSQAARTKQQAVVNQDAPSNPGADRNVDQVLVSLPGAVLPFPEGGQIGIVPQAYRDLECFFQTRSERHIYPARYVGSVKDYPFEWIKRSWRCDTDCAHLALSRPDGLNEIDQLLQWGIRFMLGGCSQQLFRHDASGRVACSPDAGSADIDGDMIFHTGKYSIRLLALARMGEMEMRNVGAWCGFPAAYTPTLAQII